MRFLARAREPFARYVWNRGTLQAILLSSPAILGTVGSFGMARSIDAEISVLSSARDRLAEDIRSLDGFTRDVERYQLDRAAFLLVLSGSQAEDNLRYALDRLFRLNALGAMRRMVSVADPADWSARMRPYEDLVAQSYADRDSVQKLQAIESAAIAEAGRRLTDSQQQLNAVTARIEDRSAFRSAVVALGSGLMYALTMLVFFLKLNFK